MAVSITTILGSDRPADSRVDINTNFDNLKTAVETVESDLSTHASDTSTHGVAQVAGMADIDTHASDTSTHGVGEIVGRTETQTITNKTISASSNTITDLSATNMTNRTRSIWVPASMFGAHTGSPVRDISTAGNYIGWLLDDASTEVIVSEFIPIPSDFDSGNITIKSYWSQETAGSGNVVIDAQYSIAGDGEATTGITGIGNATVATPGTADLLKVYTHSNSVAGVADGDLLKFRFIRVGGDGSDTKSGDIRFYGFLIEYTADM